MTVAADASFLLRPAEGDAKLWQVHGRGVDQEHHLTSVAIPSAIGIFEYLATAIFGEATRNPDARPSMPDSAIADVDSAQFLAELRLSGKRELRGAHARTISPKPC